MRKTSIILLAAMCLCLCGCAKVGTTVSTEDGYYAEERMSETEYQVFLSKKTAGVLDRLTAHAATARNIARGEYKAENEAKNVKVTIGVVEESIEDIQCIGAAIDYEMTRENLLDQLGETKTHLENYLEYLESGKDVKQDVLDNFATQFKNDFTVIAAS